MKEHYPFLNTPLPYGFDALEPYIDAQTMELHHNRHLQTYIENLNAALRQQPRLQTLSLAELLAIAPTLPEPLATTVAHNAGGVYNHQFYFNGLAAPGNTPGSGPTGQLADAIIQQYGSVAQMLEQLAQTAAGVFGSGYAWLVLQPGGGLAIVATADQETPLTLGFCPVLAVDVWEHAYYLKHYNKRADYLADWQQVINWSQAAQNYAGCLDAKVCQTDGCRYIYRS